MNISDQRTSIDVQRDGLSNSALGYPILINRTRVPSCEHLFHSLKFPEHPLLQQSIISTPSPNSARLMSLKEYNKVKVRPDWKDIQIDVMDFCLRMKLIWNWVAFGKVLSETNHQEIRECSSRRDRFWGISPKNGGFVGENHLGKLLMTLRDEYLGDDNESLRFLRPPTSLSLKFLGREIDVIDRRRHLLREGTQLSAHVASARPISLSH